MIRHLKAHGSLGRNWLKSSIGNALHDILCGAGHNLRMILAHLRVLHGASFANVMLAAINSLRVFRPQVLRGCRLLRQKSRSKPRHPVRHQASTLGVQKTRVSKTKSF